MSQRKRRARQWKRQDSTLMHDLEVRARFMARRLAEPADDLLQEASLAIWRMSPDAVDQAKDATDLQRRVGEAAMHRAARRWKATEGVDVISLDRYLREERRAVSMGDEWGAPRMPRRNAA